MKTTRRHEHNNTRSTALPHPRPLPPKSSPHWKPEPCGLTREELREIVAQNMAAEILTDPAPPAIGDASGTIRNAGRQFAWTRHVAPRADFGVLSITLTVREVTPGRASQAITLDFARLPAS